MLRFEQPVKIGRMQNQLLTIGLTQPHRLFHHRTSTTPSAPLSSLFHHPFAIPEIKKITNSEKERGTMRGSLSHSDSEKLVTEIEGLRRLSPEELDQRWRRLFESERPNRMCGSLLRQRLAYWLQEKVLGGLKVSTRRLFQQIATNGTT